MLVRDGRSSRQPYDVSDRGEDVDAVEHALLEQSLAQQVEVATMLFEQLQRSRVRFGHHPLDLAVDDQARQSRAERVFYLNNTLDYLRVSPSNVRVRGGGSLRVSFRLAHPATVTLKISTVSGAIVQTVRRRLRAGTTSIRWNGRYGTGVRAFSGPYVASVKAVNAFGPTQLERRFQVSRAR